MTKGSCTPRNDVWAANLVVSYFYTQTRLMLCNINMAVYCVHTSTVSPVHSIVRWLYTGPQTVQAGCRAHRGEAVMTSARASVSTTAHIVSKTIDHCLQCQFKPSPWRKTETEVQAEASPYSRSCITLCRFQWINEVWTGCKFSPLCQKRKLWKTALCWHSTWWNRTFGV